MTRALLWLPFVVGCAAIWMVSGMGDPPVPDALSFELSDKLLHAAAYAGLAVLATIGARTPVPGRMWALAAGLATLYGVVDELHQSFVPGRSPSLGDVIADGVGAMAGAGVVSALVSRRRRRAKAAPQAS